MTRPPLFVELCAGTAALSLRLAHPKGRPVVPRMGCKTGYADAILSVLGLRRGLGAERFLWCEPDAGCRLMLRAYTDRALALEAAKIIRSWAGEEPRALWERLKAEGPVKDEGAYDIAKYARLLSANRLIPGVWSEDGRWVNAARDGGPHTTGGGSFGGDDFATPIETIASAFTAAPVLPISLAPDALAVEPADLPPGTIVYMDPPYVDTTGYAHDLPRADVIMLARRWAVAGATVCISEQVAIPELLADGWFGVEITSARKGAERRFSKQQREWLTLNRPPAWTPGEQIGLFG